LLGKAKINELYELFTKIKALSITRLL